MTIITINGEAIEPGGGVANIKVPVLRIAGGRTD